MNLHNKPNEVFELPELETSPQNFDIERKVSQTTIGTPKFNNEDAKYIERRQFSKEYYANENYRSETNPTEAPQNPYAKPNAIKIMDFRVKQTHVPQSLSGHHPPRNFRNDSMSALLNEDNSNSN